MKNVIAVAFIVILLACCASAAFGGDTREYTHFGKYQPDVVSRCDSHGNRIYMTTVGIGGANIPFGGDIFVLSPDQHADCP